MPLFQVDIQKELGGEFWTNRYTVNATDMNVAIDIGGEITALERAVHLAAVTFERYRVSVPGEENDMYSITLVEQPGLITVTAAILPLFCAVRVDFGTQFGRPGRKYLRGCLDEAQVVGSVLETATRGAVGTLYADELIGAGYVTSPSGALFLSASVKSPIAMRQLRRGSRRRTEPILPVS